MKHLCPICENKAAVPDFLCPECRKKVEAYNRLPKCSVCGQPKTTEPVCTTCKEQKPQFSLALSCYHYDKEFRSALLDYKFHGQFYKAKGFSMLLLEKLKKSGLEIDCITAVPVGPKTYLKYGYNAPLELALCMKRMLKLSCYPNLLRKKWFVKRQSTLPAHKRAKNVKGSFFLNRFYKKKIKGKQILLLDDVFTTGATVSECSRILKQNGASKVYVLTLLGNASGE
ncbi:MAG: ComF family protein [Clostridia bacterium]|nr:ComF family protein [Clostridia bacterium]